LIESDSEDVRFFDKDGTFALLAIRDYTLVLVFRGTETGDQRDYVTDNKIIQESFLDYSTAHQGFIQALDTIDNDIDATIATHLAQNSRPFWVSGHSLGGALATLYALRHPEQATAVYATGAPRIGGFKFAKNAEALAQIESVPTQ
jgi:triacylglycerol lipase